VASCFLDTDLFDPNQPVLRATTMTPVMIQTAGTNTHINKCRGISKREKDTVVLSAGHLSNPPRMCGYGNLQEKIETTKNFLKEKCEKKLNNIVRKGVLAAKQGKDVIVVCKFGNYRSRAVAELIGDNFHPSRVFYVHREYY